MSSFGWSEKNSSVEREVNVKDEGERKNWENVTHNEVWC